ncbi:MAG: hypothetical protein F4X72_05900 [Dehalococcoidia bacterium]|nr:hypothetical protein [Dehalococcoidia bacterium]
MRVTLLSVAIALVIACGSTKELDTDDLISEFGCSWVAETYNSVIVTGRDNAVQHVANWMTIKLDDGTQIGYKDAEAVVNECASGRYNF